MPNRLLRDWTDSEKVHALSAEAERMFVRLIMKVDDFGRYKGNPKLLLSDLFPLHDSISVDMVNGWLHECVNAGLVHKYQVDGKQFVEIKGFNQKGLKVRKAKYPPSDESERYELLTGYVYIIGVSFKHPVKVGFSMNPWSRLKEISANHPDELKLLLTFRSEKRTESLLHAELKSKRVKNEWFILTEADVLAFQLVADGDINVSELLSLLRSNDEELRSTTLPELEVEEEVELEVKKNALSRKPYSRDNYYESPANAFDDIKSDELLVERLIRVVHGHGFRTCGPVDVMLAAKHFLTVEGAKEGFSLKPKKEVKSHLVNWINKNAAKIHEYKSNGVPGR